MNDVLKILTDRAAWYRDGCEGLEDREGYYSSGDCARDAASDLETALSEIRVLEAVIAKLAGTESERSLRNRVAKGSESLSETPWVP